MDTLRYTLRKLLYSVPLILGVTLLSFTLMVYFGPDMAYEKLGKNATIEDLEREREKLGQNKPFIVRYGNFLQSVVTFDFGESNSTNRKVTEMFSSTIPVSILVALPGFVFGNLISIVFGLWAAYHRGRRLDKGIMAGAVVGMSISFLIVVIVFQLLFCSSSGLNWFPSTGWEVGMNLQEFNILDYMEYVTVPTLCTIFVSVGYNTRFYRAVFVEELTRDHVRTAKAFGCGPVRLLFKHVLKNSLIPILTRIILSLPFVIIGGSIIIESYFGIPGVGSVVYDAIVNGDQPVTKAAVVCTAILYLVFLTLTDILYQVVDPRISLK
ncbi:ABC transporter permease [Candidatus Uabimicrobium sp. HlEnr_7]|uniref:ABC transporter permease n=1 Tax=Candidatus Uabimicrobium helgolandensis TaxID=3095367 RepID=UPI003557CE1C